MTPRVCWLGVPHREHAAFGWLAVAPPAPRTGPALPLTLHLALLPSQPPNHHPHRAASTTASASWTRWWCPWPAARAPSSGCGGWAVGGRRRLPVPLLRLGGERSLPCFTPQQPAPPTAQTHACRTPNARPRSRVPGGAGRAAGAAQARGGHPGHLLLLCRHRARGPGAGGGVGWLAMFPCFVAWRLLARLLGCACSGRRGRWSWFAFVVSFFPGCLRVDMSAHSPALLIPPRALPCPPPPQLLPHEPPALAERRHH